MWRLLTKMPPLSRVICKWWDLTEPIPLSRYPRNYALDNDCYY
jgi:hypothetical protein